MSLDPNGNLWAIAVALSLGAVYAVVLWLWFAATGCLVSS
jgi:hypothetical protein